MDACAYYFPPISKNTPRLALFYFVSLSFLLLNPLGNKQKIIRVIAMQKKNLLETLMGALVLIVGGGFLVFAYEGSQLRVEKGYTISAKFNNASGIALGSDVRVGGIKVGVVSELSLDTKTYEAVLKMQIREDTKMPRDSSAAISSSGLLGDKFVSLTPGADEKMLAEGGKIQFTQSSVSLEELIGKFMFSGGGVDKGGKDSAAAGGATTKKSSAINTLE